MSIACGNRRGHNGKGRRAIWKNNYISKNSLYKPNHLKWKQGTPDNELKQKNGKNLSTSL